MSENVRHKLAARQFFYRENLKYYEIIKRDAEKKLSAVPPRSEDADIYRAIIQVAVDEKKKLEDHLMYLERL